jgi:hypothetical protein
MVIFAPLECFEKAPTLKSDVFSFGLILYELLSDRPGFARDLSRAGSMTQIIVDQTGAGRRRNVARNVAPATQ